MLMVPFRGEYIRARVDGKIMLSTRALFELDDGETLIRYFKPNQKIPFKGLLDIQDYIHVGNGQFWVSRLTGRFAARQARELPTKWVRGKMERVGGQLTHCYISPNVTYATFPRNAYGANFRVFGVLHGETYCVPAETHLEVGHFIGLMSQIDMVTVEVAHWDGRNWERYNWKETNK